MIQEIYIIDDDESSLPVFEKLFIEEKDFKFIGVKTEQIDIALKNIPFLIVINEDAIDRDVVGLCKKIRTDEDNQITPIIIVSSNTDRKHRIEVLKQSVEYYIKKPVDADYLYYTIKNLNRLLTINRKISPLTGLPGNVQIHAELKKRLSKGESFSVLYLDLDNFKAYNDVYGFLKGDEIIKFTAKTILENINNVGNNDVFVGHIGGDDFVAILGNGIGYEDVCQNIIAQFDKGVKYFFTEEDYNRGYLKIQNRKGKMEHFFLTSISIGVVSVECDKFSNVLEIGEVGAQVKHIAKKYKGSCYAIDRRKH